MTTLFNADSTNFERDHFNVLSNNPFLDDQIEVRNDGNDNPLIENEEEQIIASNQSNVPSIFTVANKPAENIVSRNCFTKPVKTVYKKEKTKKKVRKEKPDNIRKKIKVNFHYNLYKRIKNILKSVDSTYSFKRLPQEMITCVTKESNKQLMNKTLEEIINSCFYGLKEKDKNNIKYKSFMLNKRKDKIIINLKQNIMLINELKNSNDSARLQIYENCFSVKYKKLFNNYFHSNDFTEFLEKERDKCKNKLNNNLKKQKSESKVWNRTNVQDYIDELYIKARDFEEYYNLSNPSNETTTTEEVDSLDQGPDCMNVNNDLLENYHPQEEWLDNSEDNSCSINGSEMFLGIESHNIMYCY